MRKLSPDRGIPLTWGMIVVWRQCFSHHQCPLERRALSSTWWQFQGLISVVILSAWPELSPEHPHTRSQTPERPQTLSLAVPAWAVAELLIAEIIRASKPTTTHSKHPHHIHFLWDHRIPSFTGNLTILDSVMSSIALPTPLRLWQTPHRAWRTLCNKCILNRNFSFSVSPVSRSLGLLSEHLCLNLKKQKTKTRKKNSYGSLHLVIDFSIPPSSLVSTCSWSSVHIHWILPWSQSLPSFNPTPILPSPWVPLVPLVFSHLTTSTTPPFLSPRCPQLYSAIHSSALTQDFVTAQYCSTSNTFDLKLQVTQWPSHRKMVKLL